MAQRGRKPSGIRKVCFSVKVTPDVHRLLKVGAALKESTVSNLVTDWAREHLAAYVAISLVADEGGDPASIHQDRSPMEVHA